MADFEKLIEEGGFVEHAKFGGNRYGTSKSMIEDFIKGGKVVVLDIEMEVRFLFALSAEVKDWECKAYGGEPWDSWECQTEEGLDTLLCCSQPLRA
jgi:guanylate kinase